MKKIGITFCQKGIKYPHCYGFIIYFGRYRFHLGIAPKNSYYRQKFWINKYRADDDFKDLSTKFVVH